MDKTKKILINKAFKKELSHFYILEPNQSCDTEYLQEWSYDLIKNIYLNQGLTLPESQLINHQDILLTKPSAKNYTISDFEEFMSFMNYKATSLDRKYVIITESHLLSIKVANKLLKTLEEPPIDVCILMLNNKKVNILDTIVSRSISIRVSNSDQTEESLEHTDFQDHLELAQKIKKDPKLEEILQKILLEKISNNTVNLKTTNAVQDYFIEYKNDSLYNNPANTRVFKLFNLLNSIS